jgi:hypothetical protein
MDSSHGFAAVTAASLAPVLVYLSHWPLAPLTLDNATPIAALLIGVGGAVYRLFANLRKSATPAPTPGGLPPARPVGSA